MLGSDNMLDGALIYREGPTMCFPHKLSDSTIACFMMLDLRGLIVLLVSQNWSWNSTNRNKMKYRVPGYENVIFVVYVNPPR